MQAKHPKIIKPGTMPKHGRQQILATLQSLYRSELKSSANSTRSTGPWACAMGSAEVGLQKHRSLLKSWFTSPKCAPPHSMGTGGASIHRPRCITGRNFCDTRATHTPSAVTMDPCHTSYSGISMTRERTFAPAGFAIGIVTVLSVPKNPNPNPLKNSTVGDARASSQNRTAASTTLGSAVIVWADGGA